MTLGVKSAISAFAAGLVFGLGLILAGMANPAKVMAFLDITGGWDPSLALVMAAAIPVAMLAFRWSRTQASPLLDKEFQWPTVTRVSPALVSGSALFGVGWGLAGICPGPALVLLGAGYVDAAVFILCMLLGIFIAAPLKKKLES